MRLVLMIALSIVVLAMYMRWSPIIRLRERNGVTTLSDLGQVPQYYIAFPGNGQKVGDGLDIQDFPQSAHSYLRQNMFNGGSMRFCRN